MSGPSKENIRKDLLNLRNQLDSTKRAILNSLICKNLSIVWSLAGNLSPEKKQLWIGYKSFGSEADCNMGILESEGFIQWAYPKVVGEDKLEFLVPKKISGKWIKNKWGIWEPDESTSVKVNLDDSMGILIPGVAFDRLGNRLGYGKGFYDRALANYQGLKVGIGFGLQVCDQPLPNEKTDVKLNFVITDTEVISAKN